jgi:hypothetical protein
MDAATLAFRQATKSFIDLQDANGLEVGATKAHLGMALQQELRQADAENVLRDSAIFCVFIAVIALIGTATATDSGECASSADDRARRMRGCAPPLAMTSAHWLPLWRCVLIAWLVFDRCRVFRFWRLPAAPSRRAGRPRGARSRRVCVFSWFPLCRSIKILRRNCVR